MKNKNIEILNEDGRKGYAKGGPYDCIHIGAAIDKIPNEMFNQLKNDGILMAPVANKLGY